MKFSFVYICYKFVHISQHCVCYSQFIIFIRYLSADIISIYEINQFHEGNHISINHPLIYRNSYAIFWPKSQLSGTKLISQGPKQLIQTGKYVVRAEDLPGASKLPFAQHPIKRSEFENYARKIDHFVREGDARTVFPSANLMAKNIFLAQKANFPVLQLTPLNGSPTY